MKIDNNTNNLSPIEEINIEQIKNTTWKFQTKSFNIISQKKEYSVKSIPEMIEKGEHNLFSQALDYLNILYYKKTKNNTSTAILFDIFINNNPDLDLDGKDFGIIDSAYKKFGKLEGEKVIDFVKRKKDRTS